MSKNSIIEQEVKKLLKESAGNNGHLTESMVSRLRNKYNDQDVLDQIQETFMDLSKEQKINAKKFARKVLEKYGTNYPLHVLLEKSYKYKTKNNLSDSEYQIFKRAYSKYILGSNESSNELKQTYYTPLTYMTKVLGNSDRLGDGINVKEDEYKLVDEILKLYSHTKQLHSQVSLQSLTYPAEGFSMASITGRYDRRTNMQNPSCHIHPMLAAMFIPKFQIFDDHILLGSIPKIVFHRKNKQRLVTKADYELFYDLISDPTDMACSSVSPVHDLKIRSELQYSIWQSVLKLRVGQYYDCISNQFLVSTDNCKLNDNQAGPDYLNVGDEGLMLRKLLNAFSIRPTIVKTIPRMNVMQTMNYQNRPHNSGQSIKIETTPMLTMRIQHNTGTQYQVSDLLSSVQYVYDRDVKSIVPKQTDIVYSKSVIIVNIPRRQMVIDYRNLISPQSEWTAMPKNFNGINKALSTPVVCNQSLEVNNEYYHLASAIKLDVSPLGSGDNNNIIGLSTILVNRNVVHQAQMSNPDYLLYNPKDVNSTIHEINSDIVATERDKDTGSYNLRGIKNTDNTFLQPISRLASTANSTTQDYDTLLSRYATILFYKKANDDNVVNAAVHMVNVGVQ
tara:strand:+ start:129 stop:1982 length:1854 start_codon:yes stop_codon:yes gene_type:complete